MRWVACFLGLLMLAAGCVLEDKPVDPQVDGSVDGGTCIDVDCPPDRPICTEELQCVQCTADDATYCSARALVCDIGSSTCVECLGNSNCTAADAARCDAKECGRCDDNAQCTGIDGLPGDANACDDGVCVDCTPDTEASACPNNKSCNPDTRQCTNTDVGSIEVCEPCVADSECGEDGSASEAYRCAEMRYEGQRYPDGDTGFCLKVFSVGGCEQPYAIRISDRPSLSGDPLESYCGINEILATCPAVRALDQNQPQCPRGEDTECPESGLCRDVGGLSNKCTYRCETEGDNAVECLPDNPPGRPGTTCGSSGSGGDPYCGG
jgi:hypothetical protein